MSEFTAREHFDDLPKWVQVLWGVDKELALEAHNVMNENEELKKELKRRNQVKNIKHIVNHSCDRDFLDDIDVIGGPTDPYICWKEEGE